MKTKLARHLELKNIPLGVFIICLSFLATCQEKTNIQDDGRRTQHYMGMHYGGHKGVWRNLNQITTYQKKDTVYYERLVFDRTQIRDIKRPKEVQRIKMVLSKSAAPQVVYDTLDYIWPGGPKFYKQGDGDVFSTSYDDPSRVNFEYEEGKTYKVEKGDLPTLTSVAAVELYLMHVPIHTSYEKDIYIVGQVLRPFRIRVLGEVALRFKQMKKSVSCYEIALTALDESVIYNAKLYVGKNGEGVIKREYVVNELQNGKRHKSICREFLTDSVYTVFLPTNPTADDYVEKAFSILNTNSRAEKALAYIDKALQIEYNVTNLSAKLNALHYLQRKQEALRIIDTLVNSESLPSSSKAYLGLILLNRDELGDELAKEILTKTIQVNPNNAYAYFYLSSLYESKQEKSKAVQALTKCIALAKSEKLLNLAKSNLDNMR